MNIFPSKKKKIKVRIVTKQSVYIPISKPSKVRGAFLSMFTGILFAGLFSYGVYAFALTGVANSLSAPYAPGATLDPACTPGTTNCTVVPPLYISNNTLDITPNSFSSGNPVKIKYNANNYATLTVGSNGDLTVSTNSSGGGGNINFNSPTSSNATILSNSGILTLGGASSGDENLNFDFHDYNDKVVVTSDTGVNTLDFGSMNLSTTGVLTLGGSTAGTLVTRVASGAPTESDTNGSLVVDGTGGRLYFRYGNSWHYIAQTGGFQIPNFETVDPVSGEPIKKGDFVVGMIDKSLDDNALHGVWVRWDTLKQQLADELAVTGTISTNSTSTVSGDTTQLTTNSTDLSSQNNLDSSLLGRVKAMLNYIGISIQDGVTTIKDLAVENFHAKTAKIDKLELVDSATGDPYCTWVENGQLKTEKGECGSVQVAVNSTNTNQQTSQALQDAADQAAQKAVNKIDNVIQQKVESEVQNQLDQGTSSGSSNSQTHQGGESSTNAQPTSDNTANNQNPATPTSSDQAQTTPPASDQTQTPESAPAQPSTVDTLIQDSTSALFDRMNSFVKLFSEGTKNLSAGLMEPFKYLIESLFSSVKGGVSDVSGSVNNSVAGFYDSSSVNSYGEYLWIYNPVGLVAEAQSDLSHFSQKSIALQHSMEDEVSYVSTNILFNTMSMKDLLFASVSK